MSIEIDIKKVIKMPNSTWSAIDYLIKSEQHLISAIHIMNSILDNPDSMDFHNKEIEIFLNQFKKD